MKLVLDIFGNVRTENRQQRWAVNDIEKKFINLYKSENQNGENNGTT